MRTLLRIGLTAALLTGLVAVPGVADEEEEEEEEEEEIEPIDMTLYLHGRETVGEREILNGLLSGYMQMDESEPTEDEPKSMMVTNYVVGPNTECSGNWLVPTWTTWFEGELIEDLTVTLHALSPGSTIDVRLYADVPDIACNSGDVQDYVPAIAQQEVELEPGLEETTVVFSDLDAVVRDRLILTVYAHTTNQARLFYDSVDYVASIDLTCRPFFKDVDTCLG